MVVRVRGWEKRWVLRFRGVRLLVGVVEGIWELEEQKAIASRICSNEEEERECLTVLLLMVTLQDPIHLVNTVMVSMTRSRFQHLTCNLQRCNNRTFGVPIKLIFNNKRKDMVEDSLPSVAESEEEEEEEEGTKKECWIVKDDRKRLKELRSKKWLVREGEGSGLRWCGS